MIHEVLQPPTWAKPKGYANGIKAQGALVFTGGMIGWNAQCEFESDDFAWQTQQALQNIVDVVREAGGGPEHVVRLTWFVTSREEYLASLPELGKAYRAVMGKNFPAMSVIAVTALMEARAKVEIEGTAVVPF